LGPKITWLDDRVDKAEYAFAPYTPKKYDIKTIEPTSSLLAEPPKTLSNYEHKNEAV